MADPLFPERYTDARIEALRAFATMDAEFLRPREPQLRRRAQDPPTTYGAVKSNELAAQILQKLEARR